MGVKKAYPHSVSTEIAQEQYREEALAALRHIDSRRIETPEGIYWSIDDAKAPEDAQDYYDEICMYAGSAGIAHVLLYFYQALGEEKYLEAAREAARYIRFRWKHQRELARNFTQWAYSTGWSGVASFLGELWRVTGDDALRETVEEIVTETIRDAKPAESGRGYSWCSYPGIVGDAGIILWLLEAADWFDRDDWREFAIEAGRRYPGSAIPWPDGGSYYLGVDPHYFQADENYVDPNYPMGTAGICFTLLKLYEASGDRAFLDATDGIMDFHEAIALKKGDAAILPHGLPTRPTTYYLGYCHGPAGTARFYYEYARVTGSEKAAAWEQRLTNGLLAAGAPELHSPGYWNIFCYCCGTVAMLDLFVGQWAATGDAAALQNAERCAAKLLKEALHEEGKGGTAASWYQAFAAVNPLRVTSNIGFYDGIAGIAWGLLQVYLAKTGNYQITRTVDDPYPESVRKHA